MKKSILIMVAIMAIMASMNVASASATSIAGVKMDNTRIDRFSVLLGVTADDQAANSNMSTAYDPNCLRLAGYNKVATRVELASVRLFSADAATVTIPFLGSGTLNFGYYTPNVDPDFYRFEIQDLRLDNPIKAS